MKFSYLQEKIKRLSSTDDTLDYIETRLGIDWDYEVRGIFEFQEGDVIGTSYYNTLLGYLYLKNTKDEEEICIIMVDDVETYENLVFNHTTQAEITLTNYFERFAQAYAVRSRCVDEFEYLLTTRLYDIKAEDFIDVFVPREDDGSIPTIKFDVYYGDELLMKGCRHFDGSRILQACEGYDELKITEVEFFFPSDLKTYYSLVIEMEDVDEIFEISLPTHQMTDLSYYHLLKDTLIKFKASKTAKFILYKV